MKKEDIIDELWSDWNKVLDNYIDLFEDTFRKKMRKLTKNDLEKKLDLWKR